MIKLKNRKLNEAALKYIQDLLQENVELLNANDFEKLYDIIFQSGYSHIGIADHDKRASNLTYILINAGIDPLNYINAIPAEFLKNSISLISIDVPNNIKSIGPYAFKGCKNLETIVISNGVTTIGYEAFRNCSSLTSVTIPNSVTSISNSAFYDCSSLTSVTIGNGVTSIGEYAFDGCKSLESINYLDTKKHLYSIISQFSLYGIPKNYIIHCKDGDISL